MMGLQREWMTRELAKDGGTLVELEKERSAGDRVVRDQCLRVRSDRARRHGVRPIAEVIRQIRACTQETTGRD